MTTVDRAFLDAFQRLDAGVKGFPEGSPPSMKLAYLLRPAFIAAPGKVLVWGDWSAIEARVLPWLARAEHVLDIFRTNDADPSLPDIYKITAGNLLGKDPKDVSKDERQAYGKVPVLSLGFGGALGALMAMASNYGVYLDLATAQRVVEDWRADNQWARDFWGSHGRRGSYGLWGAANSAIENPDTIYEAGRVAYVYDRSYLGGTLFCALPCGRLLTYPGIKWEWREVEDKKTKEKVDRYQLTFIKGYARSALWYGKLCLAGDALIASSRGWIRLDALRYDDMLWDGTAWVHHGGLIAQGNKATIPVDGVRMTADHEVLTHDGWREAKICGGLDRENFRVPPGLETSATRAAWRARAMGLPMRLWHSTFFPVGWMEETEQKALARILWVQERIVDWRRAAHARHDQPPRLLGVAVDDRPLPAADASGVEELRRARDKDLRALAAVRELLGRHGSDVPAGLDAGAPGQQPGVRAGQLRMGDLQGAGAKPARQPADQHARVIEGDGYFTVDAPIPLAPEPVYDVANAGPRSRFMVMGACGPFVVHNCENVTQAAAASVLRRTLKRLDPLDWMPVVMHTHDEVVTEVYEERLEERARETLLAEMERNDAWDEGLPLKVEITSRWWYSKAV